MAFFEGLVVTDDGAVVEVVTVGADSYYVINDAGFRRHVDARDVDRVVLSQFKQALEEHQDEAAEAMLHLMGQDDLFTKAMVDSSLRSLTIEQMLAQRLPPEARQWLAMLGFRIVVDSHGEVMHVEMPSAPESWDGE